MASNTTKNIPVHYVIWRAVRGGAELLLKDNVDYFSSTRKIFVHSLRSADNILFDEAKMDYVNGYEKSFPCYKNYWRHCRKYKNDIFHLSNGGPIILLLTFLAGVTRVVYHIHGTIYFSNFKEKLLYKPLWYIAWIGYKIRGKMVVVGNSQHSAGIFNRQVLPLQPLVIYNGYDVQRFAAQRRSRTQPLKMAYVGRLAVGKNVDQVIRLFESVAPDYPDMELLIAGDGQLRTSLEEQARKSPFASRIHFLGFLEDIAAFYASVDLFLFLSSYESFGNVVLEALLTGLPILTGTVPVFKEIHDGEPLFTLGEPDNFEKLKAQLDARLSNFQELADKAYEVGKKIENKFSVDHHLQQIEKLYNNF